MESILKEFFASGGVLIGVSAGAILMTPDTSTSSLCGDEPYPGLEDLSGLGLVDFAVVPHFDGSAKAESDLHDYASAFGGTVYAIHDGGGIVVDGESVELFDLGQGTLRVCTGP